MAEALDGSLALHDRRVPGTKGNLDHIVVAPAGVFVVDAKHLQGRIEIRNRGWFLRPDERLYVGRRDCSGLAAKMGWQVAAVEVSGTVTVVNYNGSAFCLDSDVSGEQFCSEPYQRVGSTPLVVGEHVTGTVALLSTGPSVAMEVFILTDPQPTP